MQSQYHLSHKSACLLDCRVILPKAKAKHKPPSQKFGTPVAVRYIEVTRRMAGKTDKTVAGSQISRKTKLISTGLTVGQGWRVNDGYDQAGRTKHPDFIVGDNIKRLGHCAQ
jgi:hypothetical protein